MEGAVNIEVRGHKALPVDDFHLLFDQEADLLVGQAGRFKEVMGELSHLALNDLIHASRASTGKGLWEAFFRHHPVLFDKVRHHVPLSAVGNGVGEQERDESAFRVFFPLLVGRSERVEEVIAPLDFIPEKQIALAELEVIDIQLFHKGNSHCIECGENPAPSRRLLVSDRLHLVNLVVENVVTGLNGQPVDTRLQGIRSSHDILSQAVFFAGVEILPEFIQVSG